MARMGEVEPLFAPAPSESQYSCRCANASKYHHMLSLPPTSLLYGVVPELARSHGKFVDSGRIEGTRSLLEDALQCLRFGCRVLVDHDYCRLYFLFFLVGILDLIVAGFGFNWQVGEGENPRLHDSFSPNKSICRVLIGVAQV